MATELFYWAEKTRDDATVSLRYWTVCWPVSCCFNSMISILTRVVHGSGRPAGRVRSGRQFQNTKKLKC